MKKFYFAGGMISIFLIILVSLCGCGGDGDSTLPSGNITSLAKSGVFLDNAVDGLAYKTATQSGITESGGRFKYLEGETITFSLGEVVLGQTRAKEKITPIDLVPGASDETHPKVTNLCRFLQSIDVDGNLDNGIQISQEIRNEIKNQSIEFNVSTIDFENSSGVQDLFGKMNQKHLFASSETRALCSIDQARIHLRLTLGTVTSGQQTPSLKTFNTSSELEAYLKEQYAADILSSGMYRGQEGNMATSGAVPVASTASSPSSSADSKSEYSTTNLQELGVDESDQVKTDGTYFYIARNQKISIVKAIPDSTMSAVSTIDVKGNVDSLYLYKNFLVALYTPVNSAGTVWVPGSPMLDVRVGMPYWIPIKIQTGVMLIDISNPSNPQTIKSLVTDGMLVSSRLIDGKLHVIQQFLPNLPPLKLWYDGTEKDKTDTLTANSKALASLTLNDLLPCVETVDKQGQSLRVQLVAPENFYRPNESGGGSTVTVTTYNLNDSAFPYRSIGVIADAHTVYASTSSLYIAATRWNYGISPSGSTASSQAAGGSEVVEETVIHKFDLTGDKVRSIGSGKVPGSLLNQFSLGEFEDVLRIATTKGNIWGTNPTSVNNVYCLKVGTDGLSIAGKLENIAPGEKIYSARFIGTRGFLVTFVKVDPLFTLDLSDPASPKIVGKLKVPGYSDYIHLFDENHLITIGKDAKEENGITWYQGVQLSIFDITNFANPSLLYNELIGVRGTYSEASSNHKAFTFWNEKNLLAIPINLYEYNTPSSSASNYGVQTFIGLYVYRLSIENGFKSLGRISTVPDLTKPSYCCYGGWMRGIFIGGSVYAVQADTVCSAEIENIDSTIHRFTLGN